MSIKASRTQRASLEAMNDVLGIDCYKTDFPALLTGVFALGSASRLHLLKLSDKVLSVPALRSHEPSRVAAAKLLVALLPESVLVLKKWLQKHRPSSIHEAHFSIFCYLDEVQHFENLKPARKPILDLVAAYLMKTKSEDAQAGWMAADLLGDHWNLRDSLPPLLAAAKNAKASAARLAAISGLGKALARCSAKDRTQITGTLRKISTSDSSLVVSGAAKECLSCSKIRQLVSSD